MEEQWLKEENDLVKMAEKALKRGDFAGAKKYAERAQEAKKKEQTAEMESRAASASAHAFERQGLSQNRQEWKKVDGAAFPELGHQHAKLEDERIDLKHQEAKFESRQKKDEHKHQRTLEKLAKLTKKVHGRDVGESSV